MGALCGPMTDCLQRFLIRPAAVRGEVVSLSAAWREVVQRHEMPAAVRDRLGELAAAALLLAATVRFDGTLILQIHGDGPVALYVVECPPDGSFRATVRLRDGVDPKADIDPDTPLSALVNVNGGGRFAVTLEPRERGQPVTQGIVPFEGETVAQVLENYMARSEQIPTRLWLAANATQAGVCSCSACRPRVVTPSPTPTGGQGSSISATRSPPANCAHCHPRRYCIACSGRNPETMATHVPCILRVGARASALAEC